MPSIRHSEWPWHWPDLRARAIEDGKVLDRPVSEFMQHRFPVSDADVSLDRLATMLSRETPTALVRKADRLVGILNRYDVLREVAGIRRSGLE